MGKRYFCDYCNRSFLDDPESRRKHLQGIAHIRTRNNHYKQFNDIKTIVLEESCKEECRKFRNTGYCHFGENCNYTHYSQEDLNYLRKKIKTQEKENNSNKHITEASLEDWLNKRRTNILPLVEHKHSSNNSITTIESSQLPPSMQPVNEEDICQVEFAEWG